VVEPCNEIPCTLNESYDHSYIYTTAIYIYVNAVQIITIYAYGIDSRTVRVRYIPYAYSYTVRVYAYGMYCTRTVRYTHAVQNITIVIVFIIMNSHCFTIVIALFSLSLRPTSNIANLPGRYYQESSEESCALYLINTAWSVSLA